MLPKSQTQRALLTRSKDLTSTCPRDVAECNEIICGAAMQVPSAVHVCTYSQVDVNIVRSKFKARMRKCAACSRNIMCNCLQYRPADTMESVSICNAQNTTQSKRKTMTQGCLNPAPGLCLSTVEDNWSASLLLTETSFQWHSAGDSQQIVSCSRLSSCCLAETSRSALLGAQHGAAFF